MSSNQINDTNGRKGYTLAVLACGTMGNAILGGIFQSLKELNNTDTGSKERQSLPTKFIATVRRPAAADRVRQELSHYSQLEHLTIYENDNARAAQEADVVLLACAPNQPASILQQQGVKEAISGKLLIHILAGVSTSDVRSILYGDTPADESQCTIVRSLPNAAAAVRQSGTAVAISEPALSLEHTNIVNWIFNQVGRVVYLPESQMNIAAVLGGATPAMMASLIEGMAQGGIELGTPMRESYELAAQAMIAAGTLVLQGKHPAEVRDGCSCPGGCTARSLAVIEEGAVRGTLARAVREGVVVAEKLGAKE
ncbi:Putative pyrroline-5-carboxylate reductase, 6-phosphogluconate dehydrogenase-like domain superfamily [Septoria linicola]|uniref:Pyrroline-5-carboxylate reductase, 6-phosphogluconate dehydrogenase-like domain superfamily n=1 Tax=Septoria linicola TaxID=215465 RepID=A0A9Q9AX52_9PEZI|nr:putative pyrroline-5-carboxylate reductase, 6-phosphogluconate dehydrogenase-like domain superfamily [Septoria linicola]USW52271.1 Putative pyrroline-5-carboxylate reductase, 6-phosphogluconate dehydrogenase-like domain superfamily [Septoria linicola]